MDNIPYNKIAILGPGLLGGSLGLAVRARYPETGISAWARRPEALKMILSAGAANEATSSIAEAVEKADLVVMATPVGVMPQLVRDMIPALKPGTVVTDVGSVKKVVHEKSGQLLTEAGFTFIGSHPMAGSEKQGISAAHPDLFKAAPLVLTNNEGAPEEEVCRLSRFWASLGCLCSRMEASEHDRHIAQISHLTHILSALSSQVGLTKGEEEALGVVCGGGFRDTSRVSSGNPDMWCEILVENREALRPLLKKSAEELMLVLSYLEGEGSIAEMRNWLAEARTKRETAMRSCALGSINDSTV